MKIYMDDVLLSFKKKYKKMASFFSVLDDKFYTLESAIKHLRRKRPQSKDETLQHSICSQRSRRARLPAPLIKGQVCA